MRDQLSFKKGENRKFKVKVINSNTMREQQWVKIKLYLPDGVTAVGVSEVEMPLNNLYLSCAEKEFEFKYRIIYYVWKAGADCRCIT